MARFLVAPLVMTAFACGGGSDAPPEVVHAGNGVDDVARACAIRDGWTSRTSGTCIQCLAEAPLLKCTCSDDPDAEKCVDQANAKAREADCTSALSSCVAACDAKDCACIDGCYSGHAACRAAASALDGCVALVCDARCR